MEQNRIILPSGEVLTERELEEGYVKMRTALQLISIRTSKLTDDLSVRITIAAEEALNLTRNNRG